ncbi:uncharacterized protein LOC117483763 [Trematomus bernacchii]|uniref:uncharacterized protein LOC117483763 n=1 Tax=Trematomus bernacchii TaxID=40690 RepID=UPI00146CAB3C|nr:uncharacterized protein LOC117483763 [Trematomus bernacchii]
MDHKPSFAFQAGTSDLQLMASTEAGKISKDNLKRAAWSLTSDTREVAEALAVSRVTALGGNPVDRRQLLSQTELQFGQYRGQTLQWLLSNDVGYTATILAVHQGEREGGDVSSTPLMWNKDALLEYASLFALVMAAVSRKRAPRTPAEHEQLVGFGTWSAMTYRDLYDTAEREPSMYRKWLRRQPVRRPGSQLGQLKDYIHRRDKEKQPVASSAASAAATSSAASAATTSSAASAAATSSAASAAATSSAVSPSTTSPPIQWRKRKPVLLSSSEDEDGHLMVEAAAHVEAALASAPPLPLRPPSQAMCSSCGLRKIKETGHRNLVKASGDRVSYCPVLAQWKSPEEWLDSLQ